MIRTSLLNTLNTKSFDEDFDAKISLSIHGNLLESINLVLNDYESITQNSVCFTHLGHQIIAISPGQGYFETCNNLASLVRQKMINMGSGCDLVCMGVQPLHAFPLLYCIDFEKGTWRYEIAHWIWTSFFIDRLHNDAHTSNVRYYPR